MHSAGLGLAMSCGTLHNLVLVLPVWLWTAPWVFQSRRVMPGLNLLFMCLWGHPCDGFTRVEIVPSWCLHLGFSAKRNLVFVR